MTSKWMLNPKARVFLSAVNQGSRAAANLPNFVEMSIEDVTKSFAASLALARNDTVDLSRFGAKHRATQSYLLARLLAKNPAKLLALKSFFRDVWVLEGKFTIQSCEENLFLLSFDLKKDRNKVIWGGPWNFHHAPVVLQEYDGIAPFDEIPMTLLYFWVRILQIPPLYSTKPMIKDIAPVASKYIDTDHKLFHNTKKARVFVAHDIAQPFILKKNLQLDVNVEKEIHFFYENMASIYDHCNLIYHVEDRCPLGKQIPKVAGLQIPSLRVTPMGGLGNLMKTNFRFQGRVPNPTSLPFSPVATPSKARRPIVLKKKLFQEREDSTEGDISLKQAIVEKGTACSISGPAKTLCLEMIREDEVEIEAKTVMPTGEADKQHALTLALPVNNSLEACTELMNLPRFIKARESPRTSLVKAPKSLKMVVKRRQPPTLTKSLIKLAAPLPSLFKSCFNDVPLKKLKMPQFTSTFTARSLNLVGTGGNVLILRKHATLQAAPKKKRGRPFNSKNKKPPRRKVRPILARWKTSSTPSPGFQAHLIRARRNSIL